METRTVSRSVIAFTVVGELSFVFLITKPESICEIVLPSVLDITKGLAVRSLETLGWLMLAIRKQITRMPYSCQKVFFYDEAKV